VISATPLQLQLWGGPAGEGVAPSAQSLPDKLKTSVCLGLGAGRAGQGSGL